MNIIQTIIRADTVFIEMIELDELGRTVGGVVTIQAPVSADLQTALDTIVTDAVAAQEQVIAQAKLDVSEGRTPSTLVASVISTP